MFVRRSNNALKTKDNLKTIAARSTSCVSKSSGSRRVVHQEKCDARTHDKYSVNNG
jgi:hypothetical protein